MMMFGPSSDRQSFSAHGFGTVEVSAAQDAGVLVGKMLAGRVYRFMAERFGFGQAPFGTSKELESDARNLAEVLNTLQSVPPRFERYVHLVREIFPTIKAVTVHPAPTGGGQLEILIWQIDRKRPAITV